MSKSTTILLLVAPLCICCTKIKILNGPSLPDIYISTEGGMGITSKLGYIAADLYVGCSEDSSALYHSKIKGRGNTTWEMPKKPYRIKLDNKAALLGFHEDDDWCLLANYADKSLVRNLVAMEISRICEMKWTPDIRNCELYINDEYQGVYSFCEQKEVSEHKVNINTGRGDILFEVNPSMDEEVCWETFRQTCIMFSDPKHPTEEQVLYAQDYFGRVESAIWNKKYSAINELIDRESFINNYIIQELSLNTDGPQSYFLTLEKEGKLAVCFVWDFDRSFGNSDNVPETINGPEGWLMKNVGFRYIDDGWYYYLFMDQEFVQAVKDRWNYLYPKFKNIPEYIDKQVAIIGEDAIQRNFAKWDFYDTGDWNPSRTLTTYSDEIQYLKDFYSKRLEWLNENINKL